MTDGRFIKKFVKNAEFLLEDVATEMQEEYEKEIEAVTKVKMPRFKIARWFAYATGFLSEIYYKIVKQKPLFTSYAVYTLGTNCNFSNDKAEKELGYTIRPIDETIKDTVDWFKKIGKIK